MPRVKKEPSAAQLQAREAGAARLRAAREQRKLHPVQTRDMVDAEDHVGKAPVREMSSTGAASLQPGIIETADRAPSKDKLADLAFAEEEVTVLVHDTTNPTDEPIPYVINGGRRQAFIRGKEQKVRRKYVEILARMKVTAYTQEKYKDSQGIDAIRNIGHNALRYPFTVVNDHPKGRAWLKAILEEGL